MYSPNSRFRFLFPATLILALILFPHPTRAQTIDGQQLYQQLYDAAMADGVISPEEQHLLRVLQQSLGLHEDVVGEALGEVVRPLAPTLDQSGRWTLVAQNMVWGAGLYGWGLPFVMDVQDEKWYVGGVMSSLAASFYLTWRYTEGMHLPEARSQMQRAGSALGLQTGRVINYLMGRWDNDDLDRSEMLVLMGTVPAGGYLGDRFYRKWRPSTGMAYALSLYGEVGSNLLSNIFLTMESAPEEGDYWLDDYGWDIDWEAYDADYREFSGRRLLFQLAGQYAGSWLGHLVYHNRQYSFGDAALLAIGRATGAFYGVMVSDLMGLYDSSGQNLARFLVSGGGVAGIVAMDHFQMGKDYTFGQSALMGLGGVAGGFLAIGTLIVLEAEETTVYDLGSIAGSLAGFYLTRNIVQPVPESTASTASVEPTRSSLTLRPALVGNRLQPVLDFQLRW